MPKAGADVIVAGPRFSAAIDYPKNNRHNELAAITITLDLLAIKTGFLCQRKPVKHFFAYSTAYHWAGNRTDFISSF